MNELQTECKRCGMCCKKGGPALHSQDLKLVHGGQLPIDKLITIRKGELAHNPLTGAVQPVKSELVKIKGTGKDWRCTYFNNAARGCTIYGSRPLSCRTLKCWSPDELLEIVEKDTLTRMDILTDDDPLRRLLMEHESLYPCPDLEELADAMAGISFEGKVEVQKLVNEDLQYRSRVIKDHNLTLSLELFYFGRPLFQLLQPLGIRVTETTDGILLKWPSG